MCSILEEYVHNNSLSVKRVLEEVDEWSLYCYYLQDEIPNLSTRTSYHSPIRSDDPNPSFSIYESTKSSEVDFLWKDSGKGISGDIFKLLTLIIDGISSKEDALRLIATDFDIDVNIPKIEGVKNKKFIVDRPNKEATSIRIKKKVVNSQEYMDFWRSYYIDDELLKWKQIVEVDYLWYHNSQQAPYKCNELTIAYPEYNSESKKWVYQIYCPKSPKEFKFRNNLEENQIYGWNHLPKQGELLIITKSNKDILVLKKLGYIAVSPRSETTMIKPKTVEWLKGRFTRVITLFDNDSAGISSSKKYDLESIFIPVESGCKDVSDYIKAFGEEETKQLIIKLLWKQQ